MVKGNLVKVGAIWVGETKNGDDMLSISLQMGDEEVSCVAFTNDYKKEKKHPDFLIYANSEEKEERQAPPKKKFGSKTFGKKATDEPDFKGQSNFKKKSPFA